MDYPKYTLFYSNNSKDQKTIPELPYLELRDLTELAKEAASTASTILKDIYYSKTNLHIEQKKDLTPVTRADKASDESIISLLKKHTSFPVITEEHPLSYTDRLNEDTLWLVDPLDGTQNFINRDGQFSILIALIHKGQPAIGVIAIPERDEVFSAFSGGGAFLNKQGVEPVKINHDHLDRPLKAVLSSLPSEGGLEREMEFCKDNQINDEQISRIGSAIKLAEIARGIFDFTVRFDVLYEWDTAAADCILSESSCRLKDILSNTPIIYNSRDSMKMKGYMAIRSDYDLMKK
jgi:3'(2'), 5'-bisphosphate nucleotidase